MSCSYKIGKLKNFIYLVTNLQYKTSDYKVYLVGGTIYKLGCNLVTFNETESYGGRFKFNTSVVCTINRIIDDTFIKSNQFKLIVENTEGMQFLVSPEFDAKYTSEFRVSNIETAYELTFSTQSNIPTKILETKVISTSDVEKELCRYSAYGITKLSYKNSLDTEWTDIDFLTCEYSKTFNGEQNTIQYQISVPVEDNNWHYDLIKFPNNLWDIKLESNGDIVSDTRLFPQYTRQTSEDTAQPDIFTITFRGSNSGALVGNTSQQNYFRWIQTDDYICDGFDKYVKEKKQVFISEWIDTGETRKGLLIERNSPDCGYEPGARYRWVTLSIDSDWMCVGTNKYYKQKQQVSYDGETWEDTNKYREGDLYQVNSIACGYEEIEWKEEGFICEEYDPSVSWVLLADEYYCYSSAQV